MSGGRSSHAQIRQQRAITRPRVTAFITCAEGKERPRSILGSGSPEKVMSMGLVRARSRGRAAAMSTRRTWARTWCGRGLLVQVLRGCETMVSLAVTPKRQSATKVRPRRPHFQNIQMATSARIGIQKARQERVPSNRSKTGFVHCWFRRKRRCWSMIRVKEWRTL